MARILDEIRDAYAPLGIEIEGVATYGTYYRLRCAGCGNPLGAIGDKLLPGMAAAQLEQQFDLYAAGLLGCSCGHQADRARTLDEPRSALARQRLG
jgi:hypothetical protein